MLEYTFHRCPKCGYTQVLAADDIPHFCPLDSTVTEERPAKDSDEPDGRDERQSSLL